MFPVLFIKNIIDSGVLLFMEELVQRFFFISDDIFYAMQCYIRYY